MADLLKRQATERAALEAAIDEEDERARELALAAMPPERRKAREIINQLCIDPEMWGSHGLPPEDKLQRLEDEFTTAMLGARFVRRHGR